MSMMQFKRTDENFIRKAQNYCKFFRGSVCKVSLRQMAEKFGLNDKNLTAWENGRSNKADYLFYYYDLCEDEVTKEWFLKAVFASDGKELVVSSTVPCETLDELNDASLKSGFVFGFELVERK